MYDPQEIKRAALEEVLRQMPSAVMIVKASSGESIFDNRESQRMSERYLGGSVPLGVEDLRDLYDRGVFELVRPDGRVYEVEEWPVMRTITSGEEVRNEELVQRMADGNQLWLCCTSSPIYDEEGSVVGGVLVVHEITEQKRKEEELRESQRRIENILESITDEFIALDREWRFTYINDRALDSIQKAKGEELTHEDVLGKNLWELYPELVGTEFYQKYHEALREQRVVEFEGYYSPTGRWFEVQVYPSEEGLALYRRDITERKSAEEERELRAHQQAVIAEIGFWALANDDPQAFMDEVVAFVAQTLDVEYCKIVELLPGGQELLLRAGVGWREGLVGEATEGADLDSQAGYTLLSEEPVIVEDLSTETRFRPPWLQRGRSVRLYRFEGCLIENGEKEFCFDRRGTAARDGIGTETPS